MWLKLDLVVNKHKMISIYIDYRLQRYLPEIKFAFKFVLSNLGYSHSFISDTAHLKDNDILMIYGYTEPTFEELSILARRYIAIFIQSDPELFDPQGYTPDKLKKSLKEIRLLSATPVISARSFDFPAINYSEQDIHAGKINFDLIGNVFFHLSSMEERIDQTKLENGYYPDQMSAFFKYRETPWVDNLLWLLDSMIKEQVRGKKRYIVQKQYWPQAQQGAVCLTHSVDRLQKWNFSSLMLSMVDDLILFFTLKWGRLFHELGGKFRYLFTNYELYWNFEEFRKLERDAKCPSTWFIAPEPGEYIDYTLEDPDLQEEIQHITREHSELGLLLTADKMNRDDFVTRKQVLLHLLHKDQVGIRQHGFELNDQLRDLHNKLNPAYSQSAAFSETPGFKGGFSLPWHPWIGASKATFLEIPTVFRDRYLIVNKYKNLALDDAKHQIKKFFQNSMRVNGVFSIDTSVASWTDISYMEKLYPYILALVKSSSPWITTGMEIASWWEKRAKVTIEETDYEISVFFPDDLDHFSLKIYGEAKIREVDGATVTIEDNLVRFKSIAANTIVVIRLVND